MTEGLRTQATGKESTVYFEGPDGTRWPVHPQYVPPKGHLYIPENIPVEPITKEEHAEYVNYAKALRRLRIIQARQDPNSFIEYVFEDDDGVAFKQAWFHEAWQNHISKYNRALIVSARAHGKTSQVIGRVIWELGNNPNLRIKIVCASDSKAIERLFEVTQYLEGSEKVRQVFPNLKPGDKGEWNKHKIVVRRTAKHRDASIEALGITSTATGGRCDLLIADDVVDRRNALQFPAIRETIKQAWFSDWTQLLVPNGRVVYICTLWHKADLSHALIQNSEYAVLRIDVTDRLEPIWPEVWSTEKLMARRREIGPVEFNRGFRNIAQDVSDQIIRHEWVRYFDPDDIDPEDIFYVLSYDPAYGQKQMHDYFACVVFGVDQKHGKVYVFDAYHTRLPAPEQERQVVADYRHFKPDAVVIEAIAAQDSLPQYLNKKHPAMRVVRHKPTVDKVNRMNSITHLLFNGSILFSEDLRPDKMAFPERGDLISELFDFPIGTHDDMCDAFSQGLRFIGNRYLMTAARDSGGEVHAIGLGGKFEG